MDIIISKPQTVDRFRRENIMIRLREIRMKCGFTQKELAKKISVSTKCISMWETGDRNPSISMLKKLAEVLGCTADKLLDTEWRE